MGARGDRWVVTRGPRWDAASNSWHFNGQVYEGVDPGEAHRYRIHCDRLPEPETGSAPAPETRTPTPVPDQPPARRPRRHPAEPPESRG